MAVLKPKGLLQMFLMQCLVHTNIPLLLNLMQSCNSTMLLPTGAMKTQEFFKIMGWFIGLGDENGNKVGVPVKASDFYNNPGLQFLKSKFQENETARQPHKVRVKNAIDLALLKNPNHSLQGLIKSLEKDLFTLF